MIYESLPTTSAAGRGPVKRTCEREREARVGRSIRLSKSFVVLMVVALLASACGGEDEPASGAGNGGDLPVVRLNALSGGLTGVALTVIEENGFDEENGFRGEFFYNDPDASGQFFLQQRADISFDQDALNVAIARSQGFDVTTFYPVLNNNNCILVKSDSGYSSPEDLVGKKVGHFGADSGTTTSLSVMLQEFYGLDLLKEYNLVETDPATLVELLDRGEVEAIFDFVPHSSRAMIESDAECLFGPASQEWEEREGGANFLSTMAAHEEWLEENGDLAAAVIAAWDDAIAWIEEDPTRITEEPYKTLLAQDDQEVLDLIVQQAEEIPLWTNDWSEEAQAATEEFVDLSAEQGILIDENPGGVVTTIDDWTD
jgi:NitT/TauT family transport system substrate-binding protein